MNFPKIHCAKRGQKIYGRKKLILNRWFFTFSLNSSHNFYTDLDLQIKNVRAGKKCKIHGFFLSHVIFWSNFLLIFMFNVNVSRIFTSIFSAQHSTLKWNKTRQKTNNKNKPGRHNVATRKKIRKMPAKMQNILIDTLFSSFLRIQIGC